MPELASERFVVHAGERNSSSAPKVQEKPLTLSSFSQEPPMLFCYLQEFQSLFLSSRQPQGRAGRVFGIFFNTALALCLEGGLSA